MIEYKRVELRPSKERSCRLSEDDLNELGRDGWILCSIVQGVNRGDSFPVIPIYYFYRVKPEVTK